MKTKYSPQNGGPKRISSQVAQSSSFPPNKMVQPVNQRMKLELEQTAKLPFKKKKSWFKKALPYLLPSAGTGLAAGLPFIF